MEKYDIIIERVILIHLVKKDFCYNNLKILKSHLANNTYKAFTYYSLKHLFIRITKFHSITSILAYNESDLNKNSHRGANLQKKTDCSHAAVFREIS